MTVFLDYSGREHIAAMVVGGMTVIERVLREAARAGATCAVVRADRLPTLPALPLEIVRGDAPPQGATQIPATVIGGVDIVDQASRRAASRALLQSLRRPYDGLGDRYVIRAVSVRLTGLLSKVAVTPNQVTLVNIAIGFAGCWFALRGPVALAGALMWLQVVLDSCDGELARIRYMNSKFGMWLDNTSDDVIDNLFVAMLAIGVGGMWAPIGVAAAIARSLSALMIHIDVARAGKPGDVLAFKWWFDTADEELADRFEHKTSALGIVRAFGRRDLYVLVWAATCLVGLPQIGLAISIAISFAYFVLAIVHLAIRR